MASYYVDPSIAGNSGSGTIGDPYGDLQYALDSITQGGSGDQINIKSGTDEVLTAELDITTYGTPNVILPLVFRGYTSSENDGGRGGISLNDTVASAWNKNTVEGVAFIDLDIHDQNSVGSYVFNTDRACLFYRCKFSNIEGNAIGCLNSQSITSIIECAFLSNSNRGGVYGSTGTPFVYGCYFSGGGAGSTVPQCFRGIAVNSVFHNADYVFGQAAYSGVRAGNTIVAKSGSTGTGIPLSHFELAVNNIIQGFSGTGGIGINGASVSSNAINNIYYDNATNQSGTLLIDEGNTTGSASLVEDATDENFAGSSETLSAGIPEGTLIGSDDNGNTGTVMDINLGAAQNKAASGGGLITARGMNGGMRS